MRWRLFEPHVCRNGNMPPTSDVRTIRIEKINRRNNDSIAIPSGIWH